MLTATVAASTFATDTIVIDVGGREMWRIVGGVEDVEEENEEDGEGVGCC